MMSFNDQFSTGREGRDGRGEKGAGLGADADALHDPEVEQALREFRSSVHAWSDAVYQRQRLVEAPPRRLPWRKAAAWALGSVLVVGGAGGGLLGYRLQEEHARIAAAREAEHQQQLQEQRAREAEQELAQVDSDVSREVPAALEPLGQLMTADESR
jgi:hypothetical protein